VTKWLLTGEDLTITIPTIGAGYTFQIDWGEDGTDKHLQSFTNATAPVLTHTYQTAGEKTITIR
jgi:hypothetical protein